MSALLVPLEGRTPSTADLDLLRGDTQLIVVAGRSVASLCCPWLFSGSDTPLLDWPILTISFRFS